MAGWREVPEGEWFEDDLGVVIGVQGMVWFGYPDDGGSRIGPFASLLEAQRALEQRRRVEGGGGALFGDDERPTERRTRPAGLAGDDRSKH